MNAGVYIHVPFCRRKCDYCSFFSVPVDPASEGVPGGLFERYTNRVLSEIEQRAYETAAHSFDTIYFGGGTPSLLSPALVGRIIRAVRSAFSDAERESEITLECNPEDFHPDRMAAYRDAGVNRVVLGLQTLDEDLRGVIGRRGKAPNDDMLDAFFATDGMVHCVDLIAGIPGQTREGLARELGRVLAYRPEHVSAYLLSVEKNTPLEKRLTPTGESDVEQRRRFEELIELMEGSGYTHYEVSNFCLPGFESRHNMKYWTFAPYYGYGPGAHSFDGKDRFCNADTVSAYLDGPWKGAFRDERGANAPAEEFLLTGLRLRRGITRSAYEAVTGSRMPASLEEEFARFAERGLAVVEREGDDIRYRFTLEGLFYMDGLVARLAARL